MIPTGVPNPEQTKNIPMKSHHLLAKDMSPCIFSLVSQFLSKQEIFQVKATCYGSINITNFSFFWY